MGHSLPISLPWGTGTIGYFAERPADRLVIFIHGFGGSAIKTWRGMERLIESNKALSSDVIFYGYGSRGAPVRSSASLFREFIATSANATQPWRSMISHSGSSGTRDYKDVLVVAHSLGAVVVRRALLDGIHMNAGWVSRTRMLLFGPAHMGTLLVGPMLSLQSSWGTTLSDLFAFAKMKAPVLDEIKKGSEFLKELLEETIAAIAKGFKKPLCAERVIFGQYDTVVETKPFGDDPLSDTWPDEDHCSVCRTRYAVQEVERHL